MDSIAVVALLESMPLRIQSVIDGLSVEDLMWKPALDSWSVHEVIAHLRACADVWGDSILKILKEEKPTFRYVSPRTWIRKTNYVESDFPTSFLAFRSQREELLQTLRPLGPEGWRRSATVKATNLRQETVLSYAQRLASHEDGHCGQIDRILDARRRG